MIDSLSEKISDTYLTAGSEAYITTLAFYNTVKNAAKMNVPGTVAISYNLSAFSTSGIKFFTYLFGLFFNFNLKNLMPQLFFN